MIGLIQKDLLLIKRSMGTTMLILAFLVIVFSASMGASAGMAMIPIAFSILILGTFALDDTAKWDVYVLCTPPAKRRIVLSKYLSSSILIAIGAAFSAIAAVVALLIRSETWSLEVTLTFLASVGLACCMNAVLLPLTYRFGAERSRIIFMVLVFIPTCLAVLLQGQLPAIASVDEATIMNMLALFPVFGILLLFPPISFPRQFTHTRISNQWNPPILGRVAFAFPLHRGTPKT